MNKICAVISGGEYSGLNGIEKADYVIACDKGYEYAIKNDITPDILVGDFDSYSGVIPDNIPVLDLPVEKDDTDTLAALRHALSLGYGEIVIYCALGGRTDHMLANIQAAAFAVKNGATVHILGTKTEITVLSGSKIIIPKKAGYSLSVFSITDKSDGVTISGVKYPLTNAEISNTFPIGVSNEWIGNAEISVKNGILAIVISKLI
ncbi:MAG: thiamine diphosphokinase [Acutalibacteraceae bacterium]|nr:thiamine diphosphokinase [Clostridia bacterium]MEE1329970.1 thiamine diphosphokinase [Acutalibacteraceae bacterium]